MSEKHKLANSILEIIRFIYLLVCLHKWINWNQNRQWFLLLTPFVPKKVENLISISLTSSPVLSLLCHDPFTQPYPNRANSYWMSHKYMPVKFRLKWLSQEKVEKHLLLDQAAFHLFHQQHLCFLEGTARRLPMY